MEDLIKWNGKEKQTHGPRCDRVRDSVCQIKGTKLHDCWVMISNRRKKCCILPQSGTCPDAQPPSVMLLCDQTLRGHGPCWQAVSLSILGVFTGNTRKKWHLKMGLKPQDNLSECWTFQTQSLKNYKVKSVDSETLKNQTLPLICATSWGLKPHETGCWGCLKASGASDALIMHSCVRGAPAKYSNVVQEWIGSCRTRALPVHA